MALMQRPHGRDQADGLAGLAPGGDAGAQIGDAADDIGGRRIAHVSRAHFLADAAEDVLGAGEAARAHVGGIGRRGLADLGPELGIALDEFRP